MTPAIRKFTLTAHVTSSVGWLGAIAAYLAPAIVGLTSEEPSVLRAAYLSMEMIIRFVIIPLSIAALLTGLVQSLGTEWGLFRHYWIVAKVILGAVATLVLLVHSRTVSFVAESATLSSSELSMVRVQLVVHAVGGLLVLIAATVLSIFKPWGRTSYGRSVRDGQGVSVGSVWRTVDGFLPRSRWLRIAVVAVSALVLLALLHHLAGGRMARH